MRPLLVLLVVVVPLLGCASSAAASSSPAASPGAAKSLAFSPAGCDPRSCPEGQTCQGPEGCTTAWTCQPARSCSKDLAEYCTCDGRTVDGSGSCPPEPYAYRGPCKPAP